MDGDPPVLPAGSNTLSPVFYPEGNVAELLFLVDSYTREFQALVTELVDDGVVLDRTAFYAGGGGQPGDTGVLLAGEARFQVTRVARKMAR